MRKTVFLSSTGKDLSEFRRQVLEEARGYDLFHFDAMEEFGARDASAMPFCRRRVEAAHIFVGLIGLYRGWEPNGDNKQRSITEMEYDWATDANKPRLMFVAPGEFIPPIPASANAEGERPHRFRERILGTRIVDQTCFGSPHSLASAVLRALANQMLYDFSSQLAAKPSMGAPVASPLAAAAEAIGQVARDERIDVAEMQARGLGLDEIEAALQERANRYEAEAGVNEHAAAKARDNSAQYWKRLGALAFLYDTEKARRAYAKAVELNPYDWDGLWFLGQLQRRAGALIGAKQSFESLVNLRDAIDNPYFIHWSYFLLGDVEAALGNRSKALIHYEAGQALVKALAARDPNNAEWQRDLSVSYNRVGDISAARGDRDGALKAYKDGLDIAKLLAARDAANVQWQTDLVVSAWKLAEAGAAGSEKYLGNALAILQRLEAEDRLTADQKGWIAVFENAIEALSSKAATIPASGQKRPSFLKR